jgi:hypothetical protein
MDRFTASLLPLGFSSRSTRRWIHDGNRSDDPGSADVAARESTDGQRVDRIANAPSGTSRPSPNSARFTHVYISCDVDRFVIGRRTRSLEHIERTKGYASILHDITREQPAASSCWIAPNWKSYVSSKNWGFIFLLPPAINSS